MKYLLLVLSLNLFSAPYGGVLKNITSDQPVGILEKISPKIEKFNETYLYLECEDLCSTYEIVIADSLLENANIVRLQTIESTSSEKSISLYLDEVYKNAVWPWEQFEKWSEGSHSKKLLLPVVGITTGISFGLMPAYAGVGRFWRKRKAKNLIKYLTNPKKRGEVQNLTESNFESNYKAGRFKSQLMEFLYRGHVPTGFKEFQRKEKYSDKSKLKTRTLKNEDLCFKDSRLREQMCLRISSTDSVYSEEKDIVLIVPGFFQNAYLMDIFPEKNISIIRYIEKSFSSKVFVLNPRAAMGGDYIKNSTIDDIAIDDIFHSVKYLNQKFAKKIILIGHSQGAISSQAFLAGLTRCNQKNCFESRLAKTRSKMIKSLGLMAGSVTMKTTDKDLNRIAKLGVGIKPLLNALDLISASLLTKKLLPNSKSDFALDSFWGFLYNTESNGVTISEEVRKKLYSDTLDHSTSGIILQFAQGVKEGGLKNNSGEKYVDHLKNILVPTYQLTFGDDPMAQPKETEESSFKYIGSESKVFESIPNTGHEDVFLHEKLHSLVDSMMIFLKITNSF